LAVVSLKDFELADFLPGGIRVAEAAWVPQR
jgi:hypothetical protein